MRFAILPTALVSLLFAFSAKTASAHDQDDDYDPEYDGKKAEAGVALDVHRDGSNFGGPGVTGIGLGIHGRLGRRIAIAADIQQGYGADSSGYKRYDLAWTLPKLFVYLNPKSKTQIFATTGLDMRVSHFDDGVEAVPAGVPWGHFYMGTFLGAGVEHRMDKTWALRFEIDWFMRGRIDGSRQTYGNEPPPPPLDPTFSQKTRGYRGTQLSIGLVFF
ncbi:MAG: hypothetical protein ACXVEF_40160 [Polyangiales bacterium]